MISKQLSCARMKKNWMREREMMISVSHTHLSFVVVYVYIYILGELLDDDEEAWSDEAEAILRASATDSVGVEAQDLEGEAVRIMARAGHSARPPYAAVDDVPLPFRVPRLTDPSIWTVRVKVGILPYVQAGTNA